MGKSRSKHPIRNIFLIILTVIIIAACVFSHFGGFSTGESADPEEYGRYAGNITDITIPEKARIIALGEASHGGAEFQELKLDVFKVMVEKYGVRGFALEGDYGGCEFVNRYIHGEEGTAKQAAAAIGFAIYRTKQMEDLIEWMRTYNEGKSDENKLCFYGFDMQRINYNYRYLLESMKAAGLDSSRLQQLYDEEAENFNDSFNREERTQVISEIREELSMINSREAERGIHFAEIILQYLKIAEASEDNIAYVALRDELMAENVSWILEQEERRGNSRLFITAHNGHIQRLNVYGEEGKAMGNLLSDEYKDEYYAIGTDFYQAKLNLPKSDGQRITHSFYSHDPLAKASFKAAYEESWLDFSRVPAESSLRQYIDAYTWMGALGDMYSPLMRILPMAYRVWVSPKEQYDALIVVSKVHPTEIFEAE